MKNKNIIITVVLLLLLNSDLYSFEKGGTTSFQFLKISMSSRASAMGGALTALANNSEAVFINPAGLTNVQFIDASVSYVDWLLDIKHYSFSAAYTIDGIGTVGLHGLFTDVGEIEVTRVSNLGFIGEDYNPGLTGEVIRPRAGAVGISFAKYLTDRFAFGITAKYVYEDLVYEKAGELVFDGGLTFKTGFRSIVLAASVLHFGPKIEFIDKSYPLPQTFSIGISGHLFSPDDPLLGKIDNHDLLISYDLVQPRDFDQQHLVGMEYNYDNLIFLRGGYKFNGDQEGLSTGVGLLFKNYRLDYAFNDYGEFLNSVHRFTIGFQFN